MPQSGRTEKPGNLMSAVYSGRSGAAGNVDDAPYKPKRPNSMVRRNSITGRSFTPGNDSNIQLPSRAPGSMQSKTGTPSTKGIPSRSSGKYNYSSSKGLLKR